MMMRPIKTLCCLITCFACLIIANAQADISMKGAALASQARTQSIYADPYLQSTLKRFTMDKHPILLIDGIEDEQEMDALKLYSAQQQSVLAYRDQGKYFSLRFRGIPARLVVTGNQGNTRTGLFQSNKSIRWAVKWDKADDTRWLGWHELFHSYASLPPNAAQYDIHLGELGADIFAALKTLKYKRSKQHLRIVSAFRYSMIPHNLALHWTSTGIDYVVEHVATTHIEALDDIALAEMAIKIMDHVKPTRPEYHILMTSSKRIKKLIQQSKISRISSQDAALAKLIRKKIFYLTGGKDDLLQITVKLGLAVQKL